jgi:hypothetical protein
VRSARAGWTVLWLARCRRHLWPLAVRHWTTLQDNTDSKTVTIRIATPGWSVVTKFWLGMGLDWDRCKVIVALCLSVSVAWHTRGCNEERWMGLRLKLAQVDCTVFASCLLTLVDIRVLRGYTCGSNEERWMRLILRSVQGSSHSLALSVGWHLVDIRVLRGNIRGFNSVQFNSIQ